VTDSGDAAKRSSTIDYVADAKKAFRGPASAALSMEILLLPLSLIIMDKLEGGLTAVKITWVVVVTLGMIVAIARFSKPWALPLALALQVLVLLGWVVSPSLGVFGLVFCLVWAGMLWMRHEVLRRRAQWGAGQG
jgi:hypothetical protein